MAKKKTSKLKTFHVPITVTSDGHITVKANDWQEAVEKAKREFYANGCRMEYIDSQHYFPECEEDVEVENE